MNQSISSLSENEKNSGKIWTLLRYSKAFQKDVKWFSAKYKTATNKRAKQATRENAKCEFHTKYEEIENINQFAATALQWMFPMPVFENRNTTIGWGPYIAHKMDGDEIGSQPFFVGFASLIGTYPFSCKFSPTKRQRGHFT